MKPYDARQTGLFPSKQKPRVEIHPGLDSLCSFDLVAGLRQPDAIEQQLGGATGGDRYYQGRAAWFTWCRREHADGVAHPFGMVSPDHEHLMGAGTPALPTAFGLGDLAQLAIDQDAVRGSGFKRHDVDALRGVAGPWGGAGFAASPGDGHVAERELLALGTPASG